jgi:trans-2,3-dihydro-3-hydroxyanthranilate isomerase
VAYARDRVVAQGSRSYRMRWVDVFTKRPLVGNALAVVLGADGLSSKEMQAIARETNLSETTFVLPPERREHASKVRIFTPHVELPFAGHPTIGTGWVLLDEGLVSAGTDSFTLEEGVGPVPLRVDRSGEDTVLWMSHPPVKFGEVIGEREDVALALGLTIGDLLPNVPVQIASTGGTFLYVALKDAAAIDNAVSRAEPLTLVLDPHGLPPVFLFAPTGGNRLYSRMFAPHTESPLAEDPATGSASGPLGAFAVRYGLIPRAAQVSIVSEQGTKMGRQSFIHIELAYPAGADLPARIEVGGSVVPVMTAELSISG